MLHTLGMVEDDPIFYNDEGQVLTFKDNSCLLSDLLEAVLSPLDRVKINQTDLLLKKSELNYSIGCLKISIEDFNKYKKIVKHLNKQINGTRH